MIKSEPVDGEECRKILRQLDLSPMAKANSDSIEIWLTKSGHPHCLTYYKKGDKERFLKHVFDLVVDSVTS